MQRGLAITAFLLVMAWQYRKNKAVLFVIVATLFADAAMFVAGRPSLSDRILKSLVLCWLICMLGDLHAAKKDSEILMQKRGES
jgi:hypothetical protein